MINPATASETRSVAGWTPAASSLTRSPVLAELRARAEVFTGLQGAAVKPQSCVGDLPAPRRPTPEARSGHTGTCIPLFFTRFISPSPFIVQILLKAGFKSPPMPSSRRPATTELRRTPTPCGLGSGLSGGETRFPLLSLLAAPGVLKSACAASTPASSAPRLRSSSSSPSPDPSEDTKRPLPTHSEGAQAAPS